MGQLEAIADSMIDSDTQGGHVDRHGLTIVPLNFLLAGTEGHAQRFTLIGHAGGLVSAHQRKSLLRKIVNQHGGVSKPVDPSKNGHRKKVFDPLEGPYRVPKKPSRQPSESVAIADDGVLLAAVGKLAMPNRFGNLAELFPIGFGDQHEVDFVVAGQPCCQADIPVVKAVNVSSDDSSVKFRMDGQRLTDRLNQEMRGSHHDVTGLVGLGQKIGNGFPG